MDEEIPANHVEYRRAIHDDLVGIAEVFLKAFPESVDHYVGHPIGPAALADIFGICLDAEPEAFFVALVDGNVSGYVFAPARISRLFRAAVMHGHLLKLLWGWISGGYGIGFKPVRVSISNWVSIFGESKSGEHRTDARILSIAVAPGTQGKGLGTGLMNEALEYLRECGVHMVRLEVRPDNLPAIHIYEKLGFRIKGQTSDTQGDWLIMTKDMVHDEPH